MGGMDTKRPGAVFWRDISVQDATGLRDFYKQVVGWETTEFPMSDGYSDYNMIQPGTGEVVAGICHARGSNASLPPQWLMYILVEDIEASIKACQELGGKVVDGPRDMGGSLFCVIQDPAGAVAALYQAATE